MTETMTLNEILGINISSYSSLSTTDISLSDEELAMIHGGSWSGAVSVATAAIAAGAVLVTGGGILAAAGVGWGLAAVGAGMGSAAGAAIGLGIAGLMGGGS